jgi:hypothetical protein
MLTGTQLEGVRTKRSSTHHDHHDHHADQASNGTDKKPFLNVREVWISKEVEVEMFPKDRTETTIVGSHVIIGSLKPGGLDLDLLQGAAI